MANGGPIEVVEEIPPNFFKIVIYPQEYLFKIPDDFAGRYGYLLPDFPTIKTVDGINWKVKVLRDDDGEIWLKGLETFYDFYSIDFGHMFVFKYNRESVFHVHIYDTSATEIDYYSFNDSIEELNQIVAMEDAFPIEKKRKRSKASDGHPATKSVGKKKNLEASNNLRTRTLVKRSRIRHETSIAYQKAVNSKAGSSRQNYFISLIQPSYTSYMFVPEDFQMNHLKDKKKEVQLCVSGKMWCVYFKYLRDTRISGGWSLFLKENHVHLGDACAFEVRKGNNLIWDVEIHRN